MIKHSKNKIELGCESPWSKSTDEVLASLTVDSDQGLSHTEVTRRLHTFGHNELRAKKQRPIWAIFFDQFRSIVILLLMAAGALTILFQDYVEGVAILSVVAINALLGFFTEWRAIRSMEALKRLGRVDTVVIRDGIPRDSPAQLLVPGDIVVLEGGDIIPADMRLIQSSKLQADESSLTGPWHLSQVAMSILNTRFSRWAQVMAAWRSAGVLSDGREQSLFLLLPLPRTAGVIIARCLLLGAKTP